MYVQQSFYGLFSEIPESSFCNVVQFALLHQLVVLLQPPDFL